MATTRESIEDVARWALEILRIGARRGVVIGVVVALFALAVVVSTRETISRCSDVTDAQRARIESLLEPSATRSFHTAASGTCRDGTYTAPIVGVSGDMEAVTRQLVADGWREETEYIAYFRQSWRRCFSFDRPGWEDVQILVDATRGGTVTSVQATAPERATACELERRDTSRIFPP